MIRRPPRSTQSRSSAASDVYKRQEGNVFFENELGQKEELQPGDYTLIEPMVKHWVQATIDSHLILFK